MLQMLQEMMALPGHCMVFPSQAALKSLNVLSWHPDHEDFPLTDKPESQHYTPFCVCLYVGVGV